MADFIRVKPLPFKSFGNCELCAERPSTFYAIRTLNKADAASFVCEKCVPETAVEIGRGFDLYEAA